MNEKEVYHGTHSHFEETLLKVLLEINATLQRQNEAIQRNTIAIHDLTSKVDSGLWKIAEEVHLAANHFKE